MPAVIDMYPVTVIVFGMMLGGAVYRMIHCLFLLVVGMSFDDAM
ncbi:MAG: hypothetical protein OHK0046_50330 [Anaerolineae bacterium]